MMNKGSKIYVAGHNGMVGSVIVRQLRKEGYDNIVTCSVKELDLRRQAEDEKFLKTEKPEYVFLAAAKVGGIMANSEYPADFMYDNMILEMNVIERAYENKVNKLLFLGSSCIYPRMANDNYHPEHSHVLPALIRRFHEAKENGGKTVTIWGSGTPLREFLLHMMIFFIMKGERKGR